MLRANELSMQFGPGVFFPRVDLFFAVGTAAASSAQTPQGKSG